MNEWTKHYAGLDAPLRYGAPATYALAADWMQPCNTVGDWGCGGGGLRGYIRLISPHAEYIGIDGSDTPYANVRADLAGPVDDLPVTEGVVLRHVLEHSYDWQVILANAIERYMSRLCIVLFTPLVSSTHVLHTEPDYEDVPVIGFNIDDIVGPLRDDGARVSHHEYFLDGAHFGRETVVYAWRRP